MISLRSAPKRLSKDRTNASGSSARDRVEDRRDLAKFGAETSRDI
jgi:hypothetical protein